MGATHLLDIFVRFIDICLILQEVTFPVPAGVLFNIGAA